MLKEITAIERAIQTLFKQRDEIDRTIMELQALIPDQRKRRGKFRSVKKLSNGKRFVLEC